MGHYDDLRRLDKKSNGVPMVDKITNSVNPDHYKVGGIETIDFMEAKLSHEEFIGYLKGNILKYTSRLGHKDSPVQEAGKIEWYAKRLKETLG